jgi:outer membrane lipoprotein-sorting protein
MVSLTKLMPNMLRLLLFSLFFCCIGSAAIAQSDPEALRIIRKLEDQLRGNSSEATMTMTVVRPDYTRTLSMKAWSLGDDFGLTLVTAPARDKGMAFLKRGREVWNWQPSIERSIKMPPSMMNQGWMGSDLTTEDLVRQNSITRDYHHRLLPEQTIAGQRCYVLELIPTEEAAVVWGKILMYVSKDDYLQYRAEFYDEDMALVNTMTGSEPRTFGRRKLLTQLEIQPADKPRQKTMFRYEDIKFDVPLKEDFFSLQNLKRIQG